MIGAVCGGKVGRIFGFSAKKPVCHCERSEAIAPERNPNSAPEQVRLLRCARNDRRLFN
jgi:hypothetical protein